MKLSKNALGNLINRYTAVLKKCNLLNAFGSLAVAGMLVLGGAGMAAADTGINWSSSDGNTWSSTVNPSDSYFAGEHAESGPASNANVTINTDHSGTRIFGGEAKDGDANSSTVIVTGGKAGYVNGGSSNAGNTNSNAVTISNSSVRWYVNGGYSDTSGNANGNTVEISNNSNVKEVFGGDAEGGSANFNKVTISDSSTVDIAPGDPGDVTGG